MARENILLLRSMHGSERESATSPIKILDACYVSRQSLARHLADSHDRKAAEMVKMDKGKDPATGKSTVARKYRTGF